MKRTGVYQIRCATTGKVYVGSASLSITERWKYHRLRLRHGKHDNGYLQAAWNKYGESDFEFSILEECDPDDCIPREQHWIDSLKAAVRSSGYNIHVTAGSPRGTKWTEAQRRALSEKLKGRKHSPEARAAISAWHRGKKPSEATLAKMSRAMKGRIIDQEWRRKISEAQKGRRHTEETKRKIGDAHRGKTQSHAARKKISDSRTGVKVGPEHRKAMSEMRKAYLSEAQKSALAKGRLRRWPKGSTSVPLLPFMDDPA